MSPSIIWGVLKSLPMITKMLKELFTMVKMMNKRNQDRKIEKVVEDATRNKDRASAARSVNDLFD